MAFKKGVSGNPAGRKKGQTDATIIRRAISSAAPGIIKMLVEAAQNGDIQAAKILVDRICPPLKSQAVSIDLPTTGTLEKQGERVIKATLSGQIPSDIGAQLIMALGNQARISDLAAIEERLAALEVKK